LEILHDEPGFLVINKPVGQLAHQAGAVLTGTVLNQVQDRLAAAGRDPWQARLVNRLDKETSGILLASTDLACHQALSAALRDGDLLKEYLAIAAGAPAAEAGDWLEAQGDTGPHTIARQVCAEGQPCHTGWQVDERSRDGAHTLLRLRLYTGRQHQIRVHASYHGLPLVGDWVYGTPCTEIAGQALHAARLVLPHPVSGQPLDIRAPLTPSLASLWQRLRGGGRPTAVPLTEEQQRRLGLSPSRHSRRAWYEDIEDAGDAPQQALADPC
jgi:23S rRNA pseudouridine1911/1915/1917 synthase